MSQPIPGYPCVAQPTFEANVPTVISFTTTCGVLELSFNGVYNFSGEITFS